MPIYEMIIQARLELALTNCLFVKTSIPQHKEINKTVSSIIIEEKKIRQHFNKIYINIDGINGDTKTG